MLAILFCYFESSVKGLCCFFFSALFARDIYHVGISGCDVKQSIETVLLIPSSLTMKASSEIKTIVLCVPFISELQSVARLWGEVVTWALHKANWWVPTDRDEQLMWWKTACPDNVCSKLKLFQLHIVHHCLGLKISGGCALFIDYLKAEKSSKIRKLVRRASSSGCGGW